MQRRKLSADNTAQNPRAITRAAPIPTRLQRVTRHSPTAKLEFVALRHYLMLDRSAQPSEPLLFDGQHSSSQAVGHPYRSPAPSPAPGFRYRGGPLSPPTSFHDPE
ncbi:hypothetical protein [Rhizobium sp. BT03]|uniref:hypothetical protein n=1 Tax=Rhizobium sp. BT03 TaxID=3045156 RepID=UPI0024B3D7F3|nr:hypothetical protein [Rhizobium sp. BT03]WHO75702.1 hypothetical protein QMO80_004803 [Rhizobium sp. BT03]